MKRSLFVAMVCILCCFGTQVSFAAALSCTGTVTSVTHGAGGEVSINTSFRPDTIRLCSVVYEWQGVNESMCALWARDINDAITYGKQITVKYTDTAFTCETLPTWSASVVPEYVRLRNQ